MEEDHVGSIKQALSKLLEVSLQATIPNGVLPHGEVVEPSVKPSKFDDYQCNNAMELWQSFKGKTNDFDSPLSIGQAIAENIPKSAMIESTSVAKTGFVNITLSKEWMEQSIQKMLVKGIEIWSPKLDVKRVVVDFSSPNIAKRMHVGHLRSTIIGDTISRMLEFANVTVLRRNHVGDWGTQFGMLIEYLFDEFPTWEEAAEQAIGDLQEFYKKSQERFDKDPAFKERARKAVVRLQRSEENYHKAWTQICEISRKEFAQVYQRLDIQHLEEKGESFYNDLIPKVIEKLGDLIQESEGARVIFIEGEDNPLMAVKSDGGYGYDSTDLAALWYRLNEEKADWIIYLTDSSQKPHFKKVFEAAKRAGWLSDENKYPKASHIHFGLVLGDDKKRFRTRSTTVVGLADLLDEAKSRSKVAFEKRGKTAAWTEEEVEKAARAVGYGAVKYADLKNNRETDYTFSFDQMLSDKGNTAVYLLYAHARICSIIKNSDKDIEEMKQTGTIVLGHKYERALGLHLLRFAETVEQAIAELFPHVLCEYLYGVSEHFNTFYTKCKVVGSAEEESRLLLCEATAIVMRKCFYLLGIEPVYKI